MKNFITSKVNNKYYKNELVQLMIPFCSNTTFIGPKGVMFHTYNGKIIINEYINNPNKIFFPFFNIPTHKKEKTAFANQIFELYQPYLTIYNINNKLTFRKDYLYKNSNSIFNEFETPLQKEEKEVKNVNIIIIKNILKDVISKYEVIYLIDNSGNLVIINKDNLNINFDSSFSGVFIGIKNKEINASLIDLKKQGEDFNIETQKLILSNFDLTPNYDLENPEPTISKKIF